MADAAAPRIFDRAAYRAHRERAARADSDDFFASEAATQIALRLRAVNRQFSRGLDVNARGAVFSILEPLAGSWVRAGYPAELPTVVADEDALPFADASFDLIVSVLSLHAVNDLPGALIQIRRALKPDGLFIAALFAGETLSELRLAFAAAEAETLGGASPRVAPFADVRELGHLLQRAGFALPVADVERTVVRYRELSKLFADLHGLGETNALAGRQTVFAPRRLMERLVTEYTSRFQDKDGYFTATFEMAFLTGWAPHQSQQQPLRPGSAKTRLADALGTVERNAGDVASPRPPKP